MSYHTAALIFLLLFFFYNIINDKHILTKYYSHQEHTYCYLGGSKSTMLEENLLKKITKIKILKEEREVKKKEDNKVIMRNNNNNKNLSCSILTILH